MGFLTYLIGVILTFFIIRYLIIKNKNIKSIDDVGKDDVWLLLFASIFSYLTLILIGLWYFMDIVWKLTEKIDRNSNKLAAILFRNLKTKNEKEEK